VTRTNSISLNLFAEVVAVKVRKTKMMHSQSAEVEVVKVKQNIRNNTVELEVVWVIKTHMRIIFVEVVVVGMLITPMISLYIWR
jgi:hypothetical protein